VGIGMKCTRRKKVMGANDVYREEESLRDEWVTISLGCGIATSRKYWIEERPPACLLTMCLFM
jgi:hypothetical protein